MRIHGVPDFDVRLVVLAGGERGGAGGPQHPREMRVRYIEDLRENVRAIAEEGGRKILLDLEKTTFLDSAALGSLITCFKRAKETGGDLALLRPVGRVRAVIQLVQLDKVLRVFDDEATATAALGS